MPYPQTGQSLYQASLGDTITGTNPLKGTTDTVTNITTLLLWNEATSPIQFSDDSQIAMTIIYSGSSAAAAFASVSEDGKSIPSASRAVCIRRWNRRCCSIDLICLYVI